MEQTKEKATKIFEERDEMEKLKVKDQKEKEEVAQQMIEKNEKDTEREVERMNWEGNGKIFYNNFFFNMLF